MDDRDVVRITLETMGPTEEALTFCLRYLVEHHGESQDAAVELIKTEMENVEAEQQKKREEQLRQDEASRNLAIGLVISVPICAGVLWILHLVGFSADLGTWLIVGSLLFLAVLWLSTVLVGQFRQALHLLDVTGDRWVCPRCRSTLSETMAYFRPGPPPMCSNCGALMKDRTRR